MSGIALSCLSGFRTIIILWIFFIFQLFNPIKFPIKTEKWHHLMLLFWLSLSLTKSCLFMWSSDLSAGGGCSMLKKEHSFFFAKQERQKNQQTASFLWGVQVEKWKIWGHKTNPPSCVHCPRVHEREYRTHAHHSWPCGTNKELHCVGAPPHPNVWLLVATQDNINLRLNKLGREASFWRRFPVFLLCFPTFAYNIAFPSILII